MAALTKVIRNTSREHCKGLFDSLGIDFPKHWEDIDLTTWTMVVREANRLNTQDLEKIRAVSERIQRLSEDDLGQDLLMGQVDDKISLKALANPYDRAAWVFRHYPEAFQRAEHYYFHDAHRKTRMWEGYQLKTLAEFDEDKLHGSFHDQLKAYFGNIDELLLEVFKREVKEEGITRNVYQVMIYREGLPSIVNELGEKALNARIIKPVRESALTWDPAGGELEVVSKNREDRKKVAQLFTSEVMGYKQDPDSLPLKQYDLEVLWDHPSFDTDITDGIASVAVVQLIFMNRKSYGLYTVKPQNVNGYRMDVYELLVNWPGSPMATACITQVRMARVMRSRSGSPVSFIISIVVGVPSSPGTSSNTAIVWIGCHKH